MTRRYLCERAIKMELRGRVVIDTDQCRHGLTLICGQASTRGTGAGSVLRFWGESRMCTIP